MAEVHRSGATGSHAIGTAATDEPPTDHYAEDDVRHLNRLDARVVADLHLSPEFGELRRRFRLFVFPMTAVFLGWFLLLILAANYARDFMATKLLGHINVAYVFALLQFVSTFLIAWLYQRYANSRLDPLADRLKHEIESRSR